MTRNAARPFTTASGNTSSGDSCERSSSHAKNRMNGRRNFVVWSRIVPSNCGHFTSIASRTDRCVTGPSISTAISCGTLAGRQRLADNSTRTVDIKQSSALPPTAPPVDHAQSPSSDRLRPAKLENQNGDSVNLSSSVAAKNEWSQRPHPYQPRAKPRVVSHQHGKGWRPDLSSLRLEAPEERQPLTRRHRHPRSLHRHHHGFTNLQFHITLARLHRP